MRSISEIANFAVIGLAGIVIAGLATPVLIHMGPSEDSKSIAEISTIDAAFKAYKERYGSYPPSDFTHLDDPTSPQYKAIVAHIAKMFPRCDAAAVVAAIEKYGVKSPAQALCFWLGGFGPDAEHPVSGWLDDPNVDRTNYFAFDNARLRFPEGKTKCPVYLPPEGGDAPYVFFSSASYATQAPFNSDFNQGGKGTAKPYRADSTGGGFVNPNSFQIISAGRDGDYGGGTGSFPSGAGYVTGDKDNRTNFSLGTLDDAIP